MSTEILLVGDDPLLGAFLELFLRQKGLDPTVARSGEEGLTLVAQGGFGLVLLDLDLTEPSALEVLRRIRDGRPAPPVILITGEPMGSPETREALRLGAAGVLAKPFPASALYEQIGRVSSSMPA